MQDIEFAHGGLIIFASAETIGVKTNIEVKTKYKTRTFLYVVLSFAAFGEPRLWRAFCLLPFLRIF